jgi:hypothetical protein
MGALSRSKYTINFSRANGTKQKQLKSRIIESLLVGSIPVTDDNGLSGQVLPLGTPFINFKRPVAIAKILEDHTRQKTSASDIQHNPLRPTEEVERLARSHFWETLEKGLVDAGLPSLSPESETV